MALIVKEFSVAPCEECGMDAIHHGRERTFLRLDNVLWRIFRPVDFVLQRYCAPLAERFINRFGPLFASFLFATGLAVKVDEPDLHSSETAQALWGEAKKRGIEMYEVRPLGLPRRQFVARKHGKSFVFEGLPRLARPQRSLHWIDRKAEVKKRFLAEGFPVAPGGVAHTEEEALQIFERLRTPVIAKPEEGSGGRHTSVHIKDRDELLKGYLNAAMVAPMVIIEEELFGPIFRATLIDKKLVAVLRRDPPLVVGDGSSTIRELVARENENPLRRGPVFADINIDSSVSKKELLRQNLNPDDILPVGQKAYFHFKVNWGVGGTSRDATFETHPDNRELFEKIGDYLREDIVGLDFIIEDISKSWRGQERCGIIECNSLPLIGNHHFPYTGPVRNVAGAIWDMVFP